MSGPLNNLGSIWYHSEPLDVPYSPNQFLGQNFFAVSYSKLALGPSNSLKQQIKQQPTKRQYPLINYLAANARFLLLLLLICSCFEHSSGCGYFFSVRALALAKAIRVLEFRVHSMATANLQKSEEFVTNTTTASKYITRRPKISIN